MLFASLFWIAAAQVAGFLFCRSHHQPSGPGSCGSPHLTFDRCCASRGVPILSIPSWAYSGPGPCCSPHLTFDHELKRHDRRKDKRISKNRGSAFEHTMHNCNESSKKNALWEFWISIGFILVSLCINYIVSTLLCQIEQPVKTSTTLNNDLVRYRIVNVVVSCTPSAIDTVSIKMEVFSLIPHCQDRDLLSKLLILSFYSSWRALYMSVEVPVSLLPPSLPFERAAQKHVLFSSRS